MYMQALRKKRMTLKIKSMVMISTDVSIIICATLIVPASQKVASLAMTKRSTWFTDIITTIQMRFVMMSLKQLSISSKKKRDYPKKARQKGQRKQLLKLHYRTHMIDSFNRDPLNVNVDITWNTRKLIIH